MRFYDLKLSGGMGHEAMATTHTTHRAAAKGAGNDTPAFCASYKQNVS